MAGKWKEPGDPTAPVAQMLEQPVNLTPEQISRAQRFVCSMATDVADARFLLQVLGLAA